MMTLLKPIYDHLVGGKDMTRRSLLAILCAGTVALWIQLLRRLWTVMGEDPSPPRVSGPAACDQLDDGHA
jgi:hypothetical protein